MTENTIMAVIDHQEDGTYHAEAYAKETLATIHGTYASFGRAVVALGLQLRKQETATPTTNPNQTTIDEFL